MILFTEVKVPMTDFKVDVFVGGSQKEMTELNKQRYGFKTDKEAKPYGRNECNTIHTSKDLFLKGEIRFYLSYERNPKLITDIFIHELFHLMWHISKQIPDFKLCYKNHSWGACMIEDISRQILNAKYEKIYPLRK
jgi:hypothetical protein